MLTTHPMTFRRRAYTAVGALAVAAVATLSVATGAAAQVDPGGPGDPGTTPPPEYDYYAPVKAIVVDMHFGLESAEVLGATVVLEPSTSHLGDPPMLRLEVVDEDGETAATYNSWDPRYILEEGEDGREHLVVRETPGSLSIPFDPDAALLIVHDQQAAVDLATVELSPVVHEFCSTYPIDPDCVESDLGVTSATATGNPFGVIGRPVPIQVTATISNLGPDTPDNVKVTQTAVGSAGATISPATREFDHDALATGFPINIRSEYDVTCTAPGPQSVTVTTSALTTRSKVVDLSPANDAQIATFTLDCAVPVTLNVRPLISPNEVTVTPLVVRPSQLPIAVLTTTAGEYGNPVAFDASTIQAATVRVGLRRPLIDDGTGIAPVDGKVRPLHAVEPDERTVDFDEDALLHAETSEIGIKRTTTEVCVRGRFGPEAGTSFFGCDHITIVP
jgi:hypothetical protein